MFYKKELLFDVEATNISLVEIDEIMCPINVYEIIIKYI